MKTVCKTVYKFSELSKEAQERAIEKWRETSNEDTFWYEYVIEDTKAIGKILGIQVDKVYFSGFWSQGDGACFEGSYEYAKGCYKAIKAHAPQDTELHQIALDLVRLQRLSFYRLSANVTHRGHYSHEFCTHITVDNSERWPTDEETEGLSDILRDFMRWIYRQLEREYEYQTSDEVIQETITANEYDFLENGEMYY